MAEGMKRVELPDGQIWEFPPSMSDDDIGKVIQQQYQPKAPAAETPMPFLPDPSGRGMIIPTSPEALRGLMEGIETGTKAVAPYAIGAAVPMGATSTALRLGGRAAAMVAEPLASYGARKLNVALGLEKPGVVGDIAAAGLPAVVRGAGQVLKKGARFLPGAGAARHELAVDAVREIPELLKPPTAANELYDVVRQYGLRIPAPALDKTASALSSVQSLLARGLKNPDVKHITEGLQDLIRQHDGKVPFDVLHANLQEIGQRIGDLRLHGGKEYGALKKLYHALMDDLEVASSKATGSLTGADRAMTALREAHRAARREFLADEMDDIVELGIRTRPDGFREIRGAMSVNAFDKKLRTDERFAKSFLPGEAEEFRKSLMELTKLPVLLPPPGVQFGSGPSVFRGTAGYTLASILGADQATAGTIGGATAMTHMLISRAMMSGPGRAALRQILGRSRVLAPEDMIGLIGAIQMGRIGTQRQENPSGVGGRLLQLLPAAPPPAAFGTGGIRG